MSRAIPDPAQVPTMTVAQTAEILGVCDRTVYLMIGRDEVPHIKLGTRKGIRVLTAPFLAQYGLEPASTAPLHAAA
jgi:excisionase family DNA binding protein